MVEEVAPPPKRKVDVPADSVGEVEILALPSKDPNERLDYHINWEPRLEADDSIVNSEWDYDFPVAVVNQLFLEIAGFTATTSKIWLEKGIEGKQYKFTNRVTTDLGRVMEQTMKILIRSR